MGNRQGTKISAGQVKDRRAISGPLAPVTKGLSRTFRGSSSRRSSYMTAQTAQIPKLIVQLGEMRLAAEGMRVERWVASPEPAIYYSRGFRLRLMSSWPGPVRGYVE